MYLLALLACSPVLCNFETLIMSHVPDVLPKSEILRSHEIEFFEFKQENNTMERMHDALHLRNNADSSSQDQLLYIKFNSQRLQNPTSNYFLRIRSKGPIPARLGTFSLFLQNACAEKPKIVADAPISSLYLKFPMNFVFNSQMLVMVFHGSARGLSIDLNDEGVTSVGLSSSMFVKSDIGSVGKISLALSKNGRLVNLGGEMTEFRITEDAQAVPQVFVVQANAVNLEDSSDSADLAEDAEPVNTVDTGLYGAILHGNLNASNSNAQDKISDTKSTCKQILDLLETAGTIKMVSADDIYKITALRMIDKAHDRFYRKRFAPAKKCNKRDQFFINHPSKFLAPRKKSTRIRLLKYFAFITTSLQILPKISFGDKVYALIVQKHCDSGLPFEALCISLSIAYAKIRSDINNQEIESLFHTIVPYNAFYESDAQCIKSLYNATSYCHDEANDAAAADAASLKEQVSTESDEKKKEEEEEKKKKNAPFFSKYKWHIVGSVAIVIIVSVAVYGMMM